MESPATQVDVPVYIPFADASPRATFQPQENILTINPDTGDPIYNES